VLCGQLIGLRDGSERRVPAFKITPELLVEHARSNLQKPVGTDRFQPGPALSVNCAVFNMGVFD
jgi:hypothetical protein